MSLAKSLVVFLAAVASVNGLATGHVARHNIHHRSLAARVAEPHQPEPLVLRQTPVKRQRQRCKPRPTSVTPTPTPTSEPVIPVAPINVAPTPIVDLNPSPEPEPAPEPIQETPEPEPVQEAPVDDSVPSFMRGTQTGEGTWYDTGLGACGETSGPGDYIAAVSHLLFDNFPGYTRVNPNKNPMCGRSVTVHYQGRSIVVRLVDRCTGCKVTDLDFSDAAFRALAPNGDGRIYGMTWTWNN